MRANILQGAVERVDSVWDADHERVQADGHHPAGLRAFAVENVELPLDHAFELVRTTEAIVDVRGVVDLVRIRDRDDAAPIDVHQIGLIVVDPVSDVETTLVDQMIERIPALRQGRAKPADRPFPARLLQAIERIVNELALLFGGDRVQALAIGLVVADELPAKLDRLRDDLRMKFANVAVDGRRCTNAVLRQHIHDAPDADAIAVVALGPGAH